ncbi:hypothetical protein ANCDUO_12186 [Ancylostoma duodenale]|uniref:Uncharacterized protein n=1 Tax=Ancylostoma duodenale TaxID=51022 RepID=A0A0C2G9H3_9BILA|nr:hypothetical protein ANCDUO_12186 [Ancylostoma duodenale]
MSLSSFLVSLYTLPPPSFLERVFIMGSLARSEEMRFCQLIVEKEAAFNCVAELGKHPFVQFKDVSDYFFAFFSI